MIDASPAKWLSVLLIAERFRIRADGECRGIRVYIARAAEPTCSAHAFTAAAHGVRIPGGGEAYSREAPLCGVDDRKATMIDGGGAGGCRVYRVIIRYSGGIRRAGNGGADRLMDEMGIGRRIVRRRESMN